MTTFDLDIGETRLLTMLLSMCIDDIWKHRLSNFYASNILILPLSFLAKGSANSSPAALELRVGPPVHLLPVHLIYVLVKRHTITDD